MTEPIYTTVDGSFRLVVGDGVEGGQPVAVFTVGAEAITLSVEQRVGGRWIPVGGPARDEILERLFAREPHE